MSIKGLRTACSQVRDHARPDPRKGPQRRDRRREPAISPRGRDPRPRPRLRDSRWETAVPQCSRDPRPGPGRQDRRWEPAGLGPVGERQGCDRCEKKKERMLET